MALADRRSFPETRFLVARGMVGDTWSTESVAPEPLPASVVLLPLKEPGGGDKEGEFVCVRGERDGAADPSMLCHAPGRSRGKKISRFIRFPPNIHKVIMLRNCARIGVFLPKPLSHQNRDF